MLMLMLCVHLTCWSSQHTCSLKWIRLPPFFFSALWTFILPRLVPNSGSGSDLVQSSQSLASKRRPNTDVLSITKAGRAVNFLWRSLNGIIQPPESEQRCSALNVSAAGVSPTDTLYIFWQHRWFFCHSDSRSQGHVSELNWSLCNNEDVSPDKLHMSPEETQTGRGSVYFERLMLHYMQPRGVHVKEEEVCLIMNELNVIETS